MPTSDSSTNAWILQKISEVSPQRILDVGAGDGNLANMVKGMFGTTISVDAIEVWEPYISEFSLNHKYNNVFIADAREWNDYDYDLVIFGDVLEHMKIEDSKALWEKASKQAKNIIITIPIIHYPQGPEHGNPYEIHHEEDWNTERVLITFPGISEYTEFPITGAYLAKFNDID